MWGDNNMLEEIARTQTSLKKTKSHFFYTSGLVQNQNKQIKQKK